MHRSNLLVRSLGAYGYEDVPILWPPVQVSAVPGLPRCRLLAQYYDTDTIPPSAQDSECSWRSGLFVTLYNWVPPFQVCLYSPVTASIANPYISAAFECPLGGLLPLTLTRWVQLPAQTDTSSGLPLQFDDDDLPKNTWEAAESA